jgi:hypothetical protein
VIRFAIGRRQVTMTDRDEQPVIGSLQSAPNAEYFARRKSELMDRLPAAVCPVPGESGTAGPNPDHPGDRVGR